MSAREELLAQARRHMWTAWQLSSEELASQAADTLLGLGMLVPEGGAQELEKLRSEGSDRQDELAAAVGYTPGLAWSDLIGLVASHRASLVQAERDVRALRARIVELEADLAAKEQDHAAAVAGWGRSRERVAELEALKPAPTQTCRTCVAGYTYGQPCSNCEFQAQMALAQQQGGCPRNVIDGDVGGHFFKKGALSDSPVACVYCGAVKPEGDAEPQPDSP